MKQKFYLIAILTIFTFAISCNNNVKENPEKDSGTQVVSVDDFLATPGKWANKEIKITGTVSHVCKHSGKKMFIFGKDPNSTLKINVGGNAPTFDIALAGSDVEIHGKVAEDARIDEQYLKEWENEIKTAVDDGSIKVCTVEGAAINCQEKKDKDKQAVVPTSDPYKDVKEMRKKIKESGSAYLPVYAVKCIVLKELKK